MRVHHTVSFSFFAVFLASCQMGAIPDESTISTSSDLSVKIPMRSFSASPSLGGKNTSVSDPSSPQYGAVKIFMEKAASNTKNSVNFEIVTWTPTAPNTILTQVGLNDDPSGTTQRDAAFDSG